MDELRAGGEEVLPVRLSTQSAYNELSLHTTSFVFHCSLVCTVVSLCSSPRIDCNVDAHTPRYICIETVRLRATGVNVPSFGHKGADMYPQL